MLLGLSGGSNAGNQALPENSSSPQPEQSTTSDSRPYDPIRDV